MKIGKIGKWFRIFPLDYALGEAAQYEKPFEYVKKHVRAKRQKSRPRSQAEKWWLFARPRPAMRAALAHLRRYMITPRVSKHRIFVWVNLSVIPDSATVVIGRDDDYFFGVLHSRVHEMWARHKGTQLREVESGFRYSETMTFDTFPFPWPPGNEPKDDPRIEMITKAAQELVEKRDQWLSPPDASESELQERTLTKLYNQNPEWLDLAHRKLDEAVLDAYGWPHDLSDDEILARLLALNLARSKPVTATAGHS